MKCYYNNGGIRWRVMTFSQMGHNLHAETSKNEHTHARRYGHVYSGNQTELKDFFFICGDRHSFAAAVSVDGYIAAEVPGSKFD
jgi:hypothetical protein